MDKDKVLKLLAELKQYTEALRLEGVNEYLCLIFYTNLDEIEQEVSKSDLGTEAKRIYRALRGQSKPRLRAICSCENCKHFGVSALEEPCYTCEFIGTGGKIPTNWESQEVEGE